MAEKIISPEISEYSSTVLVKRPVHSGSATLQFWFEAECIDFSKTPLERAVDLGMERLPMLNALRLRGLAQGNIHRPPEVGIYVIGPKGDEVSKIGISRNPLGRLSGLRSSNYNPLEIKALFWVVTGYAGAVEKAALRSAKHLGLKRRGEWIDASPDMASLFVVAAAKALNAGICDSAMWMRQRDQLRLEQRNWNL